MPLTSIGITTDNVDKVYPDNNLGEGLECATIKILHEHMQSLPMALQQRTIEWTEELLEARDLIDRKHASLRDLQSSVVL